MPAKKSTIYTHSLEIYVPTQCRCGKSLPEHARTEILDEIKTTMAGWFGGNSAKKVDPRVERIEGSWVLGDGTLAKEPVDVVQSFTDYDTLIDQREEFTAYVAQLANRLTQEQMLCRIDGKSILYPSAADPKPHRCAGGVTSATTPKPREAGGVERMLSLQAGLQRLGSANDVRDLFCNVLHYEYESGIVPTSQWPDSVKQYLAPGIAPQIIADQNGFKIIYLQLADGSLRKSHERQLVQRLIKDNPGMRGLIVVSDVDQKQWNLVNVKFDRDGKKLDNVLLRRMRVGPGQSVRTAVERLSQVDIESVGEETTAAELQDLHDKAFDVEAVTKQFFNDVANWYFWALKHVEFPKNAPKEDDGHDHVSLIRLITRLIFCWFLREKGLLPDTLFDRRQLNDILEGFAPDKARNKDSVYYRAILQNLFFATLSTETDKRKWATDEQNFMAHSLYRFKDCFQKPATALNLFKSIPFLNGGLFECLDRDLGEGKKPRYIRIDGFSRRPDSQAVVPDFLFFGPEREIDLSDEYGGDRRFRNVRVRGLIDTLRHYNFTIEENTPIEEEVALDPELCGKVFENLLAAYNPETGKTARKQSGSFYTPREIVNYMVDEALIASLSTKLEAAVPTAKDIEPRLRHLFAYNDEPNQFENKEIKALIVAIDNLKTLDPAVGSGAFPMGLLHKLVFILGKLDPRNEQWKERQIARVREAIAVAEKIEDDTVRTRTVEDLEQQIVNVNESFDRNELDYGRKLYLIENCIYGVDIQPIAVQIAKMRFFISLIVDQKIDDSLPNRGVRPLPNLETKFVAANTLIGIDRPVQQMLRNGEIDAKEVELRRVRERHFLARNSKQKEKCRIEDAALRTRISELLKGDGWNSNTARQLSLWNPYDQNISASFFDCEWMFGNCEGFDVIIGNPPYLKERENKHIFDLVTATPWGKKFHLGKMDYWFFFLHKSLDGMKSNGVTSFITSRYWINSSGSKKLISHIQKEANIFHIVDIGSLQVFDQVAGQHMLHFYRKGEKQGSCLIKALQGNLSGIFDLCSTAHSTIFNQLSTDLFVENGGIQLSSCGFKLNAPSNIGDFYDVSQGVVQNPDKVSAVMSRRYGLPKGKGVFVLDGDEFEELQLNQDEMHFMRAFFDESAVRRYHLDIKSAKYLIYLTRNNCKTLRGLPNLNRHLSKYREIMDGRRETLNGSIEWFQLHWPRDSRFFEFPKVVLPSMFRKAPAAYVPQAAYFGMGSNVIVQRVDSYSLKFLCGLLNSKLAEWWFYSTGKMRGVGVDIGVDKLRQFPLPKYSLKFLEIEKIVDQLVEIKNRNPISDTSSHEQKIDKLVYSIFGLTPNEIEAVEDSLKS
jgi:hypothetical protein